MTFFYQICSTFAKNTDNMKHVTSFVWICMLAFVFASCGSRNETKKSEAPVDTIPMLVMQIQKCSRLYTAEYKVHKIVTHDDQMKLQGTIFSQQFDIKLPLGNRKIAIPIDATLKAYVDFSQFSDRNVKRNGKKIEIVLPDPKVELTGSRINHSEIKKQVPLLRANFSDEEMASYEKQGRAAILSGVPRMGIIEMARENAANMLIPMLAGLGFQETDISVTFRKQFSMDDLSTLIDSKGIGR